MTTENDDFFGGKELEQDPLVTVQGHVICTFRPGFWLGASPGYDFGGQSATDGDLFVGKTLQNQPENLHCAFGEGFKDLAGFRHLFQVGRLDGKSLLAKWGFRDLVARDFDDPLPQ